MQHAHGAKAHRDRGRQCMNDHELFGVGQELHRFVRAAAALMPRLALKRSFLSRQDRHCPRVPTPKGAVLGDPERCAGFGGVKSIVHLLRASARRRKDRARGNKHEFV